MADVQTILRRLAAQQKQGTRDSNDSPPRLSVDRCIEDTRNEKPGTCVVCGSVTMDEFYGVRLCDPYNDDGSIKRRCKWIWRDGAGAVWKARKQ